MRLRQFVFVLQKKSCTIIVQDFLKAGQLVLVYLSIMPNFKPKSKRCSLIGYLSTKLENTW